jgi:RHS repeat-associated protein
VSGLYEEVRRPGVLEERQGIFIAGRRIAELRITDDEQELLYVHDDRLGSARAVTTESGGLAYRQDFAPFGEDGGVPVGTDEVRYGFTGHEADRESGFVNAGGRLYDPKLGRFLSADAYVQAPRSSQSWNPYSYVFNNPLTNVDPTGNVTCTPDGGCPMTEFGGGIFGERDYLPGPVSVAEYPSIPPPTLESPPAPAATEFASAEVEESAEGEQAGPSWLSNPVDMARSVLQWKIDGGLGPTAQRTGEETPEIDGGNGSGPPTARTQPQKKLRTKPVPMPSDEWIHKHNEKALDTLHPLAAERFRDLINDVESELGIKLVITDGYRSYDDQMALWSINRDPVTGKPYELDTYEFGRPDPWKGGRQTPRTKARPAASYHGFGAAIDVQAWAGGEPIPWGTPKEHGWGDIVDIARRHGLGWGGTDVGWWDPVHFQFTNGGLSPVEMGRSYRGNKDIMTGADTPEWRAPWGHPLGPVKK